MEIVRYAYENCTAKYALRLDEELVKEYNEALHRSWNLPEGFVDLTLQDIVDIYKDESSRWQEELTYKPYEHKSYLGSIITDFINDDIWNNYIETVDGDTYDWDDEFVED